MHWTTRRNLARHRATKLSAIDNGPRSAWVFKWIQKFGGSFRCALARADLWAYYRYFILIRRKQFLIDISFKSRQSYSKRMIQAMSLSRFPGTGDNILHLSKYSISFLTNLPVSQGYWEQDEKTEQTFLRSTVRETADLCIGLALPFRV
jgi:hypothetical protein